MASNSNTLPQGFSVFQPTLGAQLQFFPAIGTRELDEMINAYMPGPASNQEKRASIALDYFEYAHLTGQTFKFYPIYSLSAADSPATASPLQDSGYGSSFNTSPVTSNWDWSNVNTSSSSRRSSPKSTSSPQATDFSNLPGMKIMTKDGRDVTNSASRGSKTKEQRDHAHLMRIIKACDSCKKKKIRCDPSHKKRGVSSTAAQPAKVTKKTKTVAPEPKVTPVIAQDAFTQLTFPQQDFSVDLDNLAAPTEQGVEPWEQFVQFPAEDDNYDFFNDPEGYFSPGSSSFLSEDSTKPVTPTTDQDLLRRRPGDADLAGLTDLAAYMPFNQTEANHDYVDFNLYSPASIFSEDERMVPIEVSKQSISQPRSPAPNPLPPNESSSGFYSSGGELGGGDLNGDLFGSLSVASSSAPQQLSTHGQLGREDVYRDPGAGLEYYSSTPESSLGSDLLSSGANSWSDRDAQVSVSEPLSSVDSQLSTNSNVRVSLIIPLMMERQLTSEKVTISRDIIEGRGVITAQPESRPLETTTTTTTATTTTTLDTQSTETIAQSSYQPIVTEDTEESSDCRTSENHTVTAQAVLQRVDAQGDLHQPTSQDAEIHNVAEDISQRSPAPVVPAHQTIGLETQSDQSSMGALASIAAMLIASTVWSYASQQFVLQDKSWEQKTQSAAPSQRKVKGIMPSIREKICRLQSTTRSGKTSVGRMVSMNRSLIAV
ncbi:uncharacterized protein BKA55DRAFT_590200 [Fusarium redolens]|uniref:Zn(2)-C6 fungal-type domain-containing protein n=1 Tax=Fusarium redolens TaxID=48865 RepID=A0A9P9KIX7_FUSRE|nr:uncharacterized protein BKA55DRAFT_590200 [Fusarium redolens]KAH7264687.1 hypothetical protein BKA55DRAFT_590200 [Fusarium redolens]